MNVLRIILLYVRYCRDYSTPSSSPNDSILQFRKLHVQGCRFKIKVNELKNRVSLR
jgi:hypothetical protein